MIDIRYGILKTIFLVIILFFPNKALIAHEKMHYVIEAVEIYPEQAPEINGKLDDPVWGNGNIITGLVQRDPVPGAPATEKSEIVILYDKENLYIGCRLYDSNPDNIIRELKRREDITSSDRIELFFDTFHNHRTGYKFSMNPYGVQMDDQRYNDDKTNRSWDAIWESSAKTDSAGWVAEFKIPFFNMRFPAKEEQIWGFNLQREIRYKAERLNWKPVSFNDRGNIRMSKLGHLAGIKGIRSGRKLELYPYGLTGFSETFDTHVNGKNDVGVDLKYEITSDVTLDMSVNPDYAQVEADVLHINLSRYPTRFQEKRKFFLEGSGIYTTPIELFYSRRIGAKGDILWGTKLSGRTKKGGLEYGFLASQTGDWNYFGLEKDNKNKEQALYGVGRVRKGFANGSSVGVMFTDKESKEGLYSRIIGVDGDLLYNRIYRASFQVASSMNTGKLTNNNYYSIGLFRLASPWTVRLTSQRLEPDFEINSTGYMQKERDRGKQNFRTVIIYNPLIEKYGIRQLNVLTSWINGKDIFTNKYIENWRRNDAGMEIKNQYLNGDLRPNYWIFDQGYSVRTTNEMNLGWWYALGKTNELNTTYYSKHQGFNISTPRTGRIQKVAANFNVSWGSFYNFSQKYLGKTWQAGLSQTTWLKSNLGLELTGQYQKTYDPVGVLDGEHFRLSMRNTFLINKDLFIRLYTQGRWGTTYYGQKSIINKYVLSFLLGWEFNPGSWFYFAYYEGREDLNDMFNMSFQQRDFFMTDRTLVAKLQYAFHK